MRSFLTRLSVRLRVTLAFTAAMAVVLLAVGAFLYVRLGDTLEATLDRSLAGRADDITSLLGQTRPRREPRPVAPLSTRSRDVAQVLDAGGAVLDSSNDASRRRLLTGAELRGALRSTVRTTHDEPVLDGGGVRLLARSVVLDGDRYVVVVGAAVEPDEDAQHELGGLLLVGGPAALLLAALAGWLATGGALAPVERMRRRADRVSAGGGERLPVAASGDEVARLGTTLNAMLDRLDEAYAHERRFVADASHELRTPLTILKGELELALRDATTIGAYRDAVLSAAEETDRLVQLAEDLLVIARADQGRLPVRPQDVDARELVGRVVQRFTSAAADAGVALEEAATGSPIRCDPRLAEQALGNVVDNALRHGARRVVVRAEAAAFIVEDDGEGFPDGFAAHAFERFTRADAARGRGGAGLGLAIVAAVAEAHGGRATAGERPGGGAVVRIALGDPPGDR